MPTHSRREDKLIELFLSAYDDNAWRGASIDWLDRTTDGSVEALVTRADGRTLAIEHTLVESFVGEREDLERFKAFLRIEADPALHLVDRITYVNVPRGALPKGVAWDPIVNCVHEWLRVHLGTLGEGTAYHDCAIVGPGVSRPSVMKLQITVTRSPGSKVNPIVRRYGPIDVPGSVAKALASKLPKLARTTADVRVLLLERNQWSLSGKEIWCEVKAQAPSFPLLKAIDEIWFAETPFYDTSSDPGWRDSLGFNRYGDRGEDLVASMEFLRGVLISRSRDGIATVTPESRQVLG